MELGKLGIDLSNNRSTYIHQNRSVSPRGSNCNSLVAYSQLMQNNLGGSNAHLMLPTAAEDIIKLKKEVRFKQAEFDKEKALLIQKNSQLESQLEETSQRLTAQASMYESMINSLKSTDNSNSVLMNKLHASERQAYEEEIAELKDYRRKLQDDMNNKEHEHLRAINDREQAVKEMQLQIEKTLIEKSQSVFTWEIERKELQGKINKVQSDREQAEAMIELKYSSKINEIQMEMEKQKLEHMVEIEKIKSEYENSLKDLRLSHEQEKQTLEGRLDRQSHDLRSLHKMVAYQDSATIDSQETTHMHRQQLSMEIGTIQAEVDNIKSQFDQTVAQLTKEKEIAEQRNEKLQKQLEKLKNAPKQPTTLKIDLPFTAQDPNQLSEESVQSLQRQVKNLKEEVTLLQGENEKLNDQVKRLRKEAQEMHDYVEKLEANEKKFRQVLNDQAMIEQDQVVELRRQLNNEKKRALEQSELMSQAKEQLERDNHKQQTQILEREDHIRQLTQELRNNEKKIYDIQSMFNTGMVGNSMNMSGMLGVGLNDQNHHHRGASQQFPQFTGLNSLPFIAQSQQNFSPQKFGHINQSMHIPQMSHQSFVAQMHPVETGMMYSQDYQHQMMLRSIQRMADLGINGNTQNGPQIECPHCFLNFESDQFNDHLSQEHPQFQQIEHYHGLTKAYSQQNLIMNPHQNFKRQTQGNQSVCSSRTHLINKRPEDSAIQQDVSILSQQQPHYLNQTNLSILQPSNQLHRIPSFTQGGQPPLYPVIQTSPRGTAVTTQAPQMPGRFGPNSRSFTCLLNEIDEQEEQNLPPGSIPQSGKLARGVPSGMPQSHAQNLLTNVDEDLDETTAQRESLQNNKQQKSRNTQGHAQGNNGLGMAGGSTVNYQGAMTSQGVNEANNSILRKNTSKETLSVRNSRSEAIQRGSQTSRDGASARSSIKDYTIHETTKIQGNNNNITNEIKDLLDKLVSYQGQDQVNNSGNIISQNSSSSQNNNSFGAHSNQVYTSKPNHLISTDSLVELRSSASSSQCILGGDMKMKAQDFRLHATAKEMIFRSDKPSLGLTSGTDGVSSSVSNLQNIKKSSQQVKPSAKQIPKAAAGIPKQKSKSRTKQAANVQKQQYQDKNGLQSEIRVQAEKKNSENFSVSPGIRISTSSMSSSPKSQDRETARHTSKDTILTANHKKNRTGRRYHEVNKSDVLTPNSPRRYQEYFKNKLQHGNMNGYSGQMTMIPANPQYIRVDQMSPTAAVKIQKNMHKTLNNQYNHRYSPSHTQSVANDSQLSPSPEKGASHGKASNMPLQNQLQNHQLFRNAKQSHYDSGTVLLGSGPTSDFIFKPQNGLQPYQLTNAFAPGGAGFIIAGTNKQTFDNSMDDDGEIRPSQLDEFIEKKENKPSSISGPVPVPPNPYGYGPGHITSSYISIGDDDLFLSGRFQDATVRGIHIKGQQQQQQNQNKLLNPSVLIQNEKQLISNPSNHSFNLQSAVKK